MSADAPVRVGLVGGLGPESTIDYYRRILELAASADPAAPMPSILIDSLDIATGLRLVASDRAALVEYLAASVDRLARAGATFVAMAANTPHVVFDELAARAPVPMLSIVDATAAEAERRGLRKVGLLGTRFTMESSFYPVACARRGIEVVPPTEPERLALHERYVGELLKNQFRDETRAWVVALVERLREAHAIDGVVLAGTELPLLLRTGGDAGTVAGLPTLDTTELHVAAIVGRLRAGGGVAR